MSAGDVRRSIIDRVERYFDTLRNGDLEARRRLFAPKAVVEDPIGSPSIEGTASLEALWTHIAADGPTIEPQLKRVIVAGHEALAIGLLRTQPPHGPASVTELYVAFEFDRAIEIRRLRTYRDDSCIHRG
jgi:ketosteroid isomerase-like protein